MAICFIRLFACRPFLGACVFLSLSVLGGCTMYEDSVLPMHRAEVHHGESAQSVATADFTAHSARAVADAYNRYGSGSLHVTVTYDPRARHSTAMKAGMEAARIVSDLRSAGVRGEIETDILPISGQGDSSRTHIIYKTVTAHAPSGCGVIPGAGGQATNYRGAYPLGCSLETAIAAQVHRPADLLGRQGLPAESDGRRAGNIIEHYRSGVRNPPLDGEEASEN